jgi:hypothetical protein
MIRAVSGAKFSTPHLTYRPMTKLVLVLVLVLVPEQLLKIR